MRTIRLNPALVWSALLCCGSVLSATENRWTGAGGDSLWTNAANWSLAALPDWTQDVVIEQTDATGVTLDDFAQVGSLTVGGAAGGATLNISGGNLECEGPSFIRTNALLNLAGDLGFGQVAIDGVINWNSGMLGTFGASTITASGQLTLSGAGPKSLAGQLCNNGTVACLATNLNVLSGCQFTNNSLLVLYTNLALTQPMWGFPSPGFYNSGTILAPANNGIVRLTIGCNFDNRGTLRADINAVLELLAGSASAGFEDGTTFAGDGVVRFPGPNNYVSCLGSMHLDGTLELDGGAVFGASVWSGPGLLRWQQGSLGGFTFSPELQVDMVGAGDKTFEGPCANQGTMRWRDPARLLSGAGSSLNNSGQFVLLTDCTLSMPPGYMQPGTFTNLGTILAPADNGTITLTVQANFVNRGTLRADNDAVLELLAGPASVGFEDGTTFAGAGVVRFPGVGNYLSCFGSMQLDGTVELDGGMVFGTSVWSGPGLLRWEQGSLGGFTFSPELQVDMVGAGDKTFEGPCANQGTMRWRDLARLLSGAGSSLNNSGQFVLLTNCPLSVPPGYMQPGTFTNLGTILAPANNGTVTLTVQANFVNRGTLRADDNAVLELRAGPASVGFEDGTTFAGAGVVRFPGVGNYLSCFGSMQLDGTVELDGGMVFGTSVWSGPGLLRWEQGSLGGFTFSPELQVDMVGAGDKTFEGPCANQGTMRWRDPARLFSGAGSSLDNSGQFVLLTNCTLGMTPGYMQPGTFTNLGTILAPADNGTVTLTVQADFVNRGTLRADKNAVLELLPGPASVGFEDGTTFAGAGVVRFPGVGNYLSCFGSMQLDGTVELDGGMVFGTSVWSGPGLLRWEQGSLGGFTFSPELQVDMVGAGDKTFEGPCANQGTIRWRDPARLLSGAGCSLNNSGQFVLLADCTLGMTPGYMQPGTFTNLGTILAPANNGTVTLSVQANFVNRGILRADNNAVLDLQAGPASVGFEDGTTFAGAGVVRFPGVGNYLSCFGSMQLNGTVELDGGAVFGTSVWSGPGLLRWQSGRLSGFTFGPDMHVEATGPGDKFMEGMCANQGTLRWLGDSSLHTSGSAAFCNSGLFSLEANCNWDGAIVFSNLAGGTLRELAGQSSLGTLNNSGLLELDRGSLSLSGCFASAEATHRLALGGYVPGEDFGQLNAQTFSPNGSLSITLTNGFVPTNGSSFVIATDWSRLGQFSSTSLPSLPSGLSWRVQYSPDAITLKVIGPTTLGAPARMVDGAFQFALSGEQGSGYEIQVSTNLVDWVTLATNGPFPGMLQFTDTNAPTLSRRFYRGRIVE